MAATSVSASAFLGSWGNSIAGEDNTMLQAKVVTPPQVRAAALPVRLQPMMRNVNEGKGLLAPLVIITRNIIGKKRFNQLRGKAIALHSQNCSGDNRVLQINRSRLEATARADSTSQEKWREAWFSGMIR